MPVVPINWLAVLVAGVAGTAVGFLWYSPVMFGNQWLKLMGWSMKDMEKDKQNMQKIYTISLVLSFVTAYVLWHSMVFAGTFFGLKGVQVGLMGAFWSWLGFIMPVQMTGWLFEKKPFNLFLINTGYQLASLVVMGIALAMFM